ncbi:MAG: ATP-binding cassette domain-containing protein [Hyphomicrobiaceae bacterium]|nr:ATP-binding cassette domain-containing protein [Hyphomicrobiaceae bacterium]
MAELIKISMLAKKFGEILAVSEISLSVKKGEVLGFLGPNGAGKSTTMKMITGFLEPDRGSVTICGVPMVSRPMEAKSKIGYLPEGAPAYSDMTPLSFLRFISDIRGFKGGQRAAKVKQASQKAGLCGVLNQKIETLSKGYKRRVGIAQAILHDPDVLILDEPTDGLDPNQKHQIRELITEMASDKAIIVSTHILEEVEAVCTRAVIIDRGRIVADGTAEDLVRYLPYNTTVTLRVVQDKAIAFKKSLYEFDGIIDLEETEQPNGLVRLRALLKPGSSTAGDIAALVRDEPSVVDEFLVERAKLDNVFRQITTSDNSN